MPEQTDADFAIGEKLTALTMGIDRLERTLSQGEGALNSEGLVPIYLGDGLVQPRVLSDWPQAFAELNDLTREAEGIPEGARRSFLLAMLDSLRAAAELFSGASLSFQDKLERLVGVPAGPVPAEQLESLRENLDALLGETGYRQGTLAERAARWETERTVASEDIEALFREFMTEAQTRTDALIFPTKDYTMQLNLVRGVPYTARCRFDDGLMDLNADLNFTTPALKHLVAHEVFPGHSTQLLYTLERAQMGESPADVLLCTANAATGAVQEGIGDQGLHLIDWIDSADDATYLTLRRLRSAAATSAAWYLMGEQWPEERVRTFLTDTAFPQAAWLEGRLRFAAHPFRGPLYRFVLVRRRGCPRSARAHARRAPCSFYRAALRATQHPAELAAVRLTVHGEFSRNHTSQTRAGRLGALGRARSKTRRSVRAFSCAFVHQRPFGEARAARQHRASSGTNPDEFGLHHAVPAVQTLRCRAGHRRTEPRHAP